MMGASLCGLRNLSSRPISNQVDGSSNGNSTPYCSAILDLIKRPGGCLKTDQKAKKRTLVQSSQTDHEDNQTKKKIINNKKSMGRNKLTTLEDWILDSPGFKADQNSGGDQLYVFKNSRKIHPSLITSRSSSSSHHHNYHSRTSTTAALTCSKAKDGFYIKPAIKKTYAGADDHGHHQVLDDDHDHDHHVKILARASSMMMSPSTSGKLTKKVSFREEPDIIIFYSPAGEG